MRITATIIALSAMLCLSQCAWSAEDASAGGDAPKVEMAMATEAEMIRADNILASAAKAQATSNWSDAIASYKEILEKHPDDPYACIQAQNGLIACFKEHYGKIVSKLALADSGFEKDSDSNGVADGWSFLSTSPQVQFYVSESNKIKNGDFEWVNPKTSIPRQWEPIGVGLKASDISVGLARKGQRSLVCSIAGNGLHQRVENLTSGRTYRLRYFTTSDAATVAVDPTGGTDPSAKGLLGSAAFVGLVDGQWKQYEIKWTAASTAATIFILGKEDAPNVDCITLGVDGPANGSASISVDATGKAAALKEGKSVQVIDFSAITGTGGKPAPNVGCILSRSITGCTPGTGYLFRVPMLLRATADGNCLYTLRIGIDPYGGSDYESENIIWTSPCYNRSFTRKAGLLLNRASGDNWRPFFVSAAAKANKITLFVHIDARPKGWEGTTESLVLIDDASIYTSANPIIAGGHLSGSTGEELPEIFGRSAVAAYTKKAAKDSLLSEDQRAWADMWLAGSRYALSDTESGKELLSSIDAPSDLTPWIAYNKAYHYYFAAIKQNGHEARYRLSGVLEKYSDHGFIRTWTKVLSTDILTKSSKFKEAVDMASEILADKDSDPQAKAIANYLIGESCLNMPSTLEARRDFEKKAVEAFTSAIPGLAGFENLQVEAICFAAQINHRLGNISAAAGLIKQLDSITPKTCWEAELMVCARMIQAKIAEEDGRYADAFAVLASIQANPVFANTRAIQDVIDRQEYLAEMMERQQANAQVVQELAQEYPDLSDETKDALISGGISNAKSR